MYRFSRLTSSIFTSTLLLSFGLITPSQAQTPSSLNNIRQEETAQSQNSNNLELIYELTALNRAKNLARMAAERINGSISNYRAESSMHRAAQNSPFVDNGNGTWTFTFNGTYPGSNIPAFKTVVTVSKDGQTVTVDENTQL